MRDYKHLTRFEGADKAVLDRAAQTTGLSVNQIIVRAVRERVPGIVAEHRAGKGLDLSPVPKSALTKAYAKTTATERAEERKMAQASARPKPGDLD